MYILALSGCAINDATLSKPNGLVGQNNNNNNVPQFPTEDPTETLKWQDLGRPSCSQVESVL